MNSGSEFIPQASPLASYLAHKDEIDQAIASATASGKYILGEQVRCFEKEFASYLDASFVIGTASGTDALHLALRCCGIGNGDIVLTVSHTAIATAAAIHLAGAIPVFVDIDPDTFTMSSSLLEQSVVNLRREFGARLKAIVPVHLYGSAADVQAIRKISDEYGLYMIEDCAQSHGAAVAGKKTGTWGHISAFSFYPTKNLGAMGDGGAVVTSDKTLAEKAQTLREYGWKERYVSYTHGMNTRLDEIQAAILNIKLKYLDVENERRKVIASLYQEILGGLPVKLPLSHSKASSVFHQYVIRVDDRDGLKNFLQERNVATAIHYPLPVHLQPAYRDQAMIVSKDLSQTERACQHILSLPIYPQMLNDDAKRVGETIRQWCKQA